MQKNCFNLLEKW